MKLEVYYHNRSIGKIESASLVPFIQYCEEEGYTVKWDLEHKKLHLESGLKAQKLTIIKEKEENKHQTQLRKDLKTFLFETGITINESNGQEFLNENSIILKLNAVTNSDIDFPIVEISYNFQPKQKGLKSSLHHRLEVLHIEHEFKKEKSDLPSPSLSVECELPKQYNTEDWQLFCQKISLSLALGICRYLFDSLDTKASSQSKVFLNPFFEKSTAQKSIQHKKPQPVSIKNQENSSSSNSESPSLTKDSRAEVYFDYTVYTAKSKDQYIATGDLNIVNTGGTDLINPLICIKVQPVESINLGGQILPPAMADTLGIQSSGGMRGWKFMDNDWFEKAQERGEYWIGPIEDLLIPPGESTSLPHFQLTIEEPEEKEMAIIRSVVYFQDKKMSFTANNDIRFSF
ncbi:hypothetical protein ACE1TI_09115 [Alteribacillus sp. JSM 102045]|uniref:hypothetical protein n=1 Tax=Alteribacillus sp. JSM 102045 TaxID=1562101 RepID=UPI0035BF7CC9